jgi:hypothetical protein
MPTYFSNLSTLFFELPFYLLTCLLTQPPIYKPTNPTYQFIKVRPSSWMMNIGPYMYVLEVVYNANNVIIATILV